MNILWPFLTCLALIALAALHLWWRRRFLQARAEARLQTAAVTRSQEQAALQFHTQQNTLLNSMIEGLLLLDESGHIQLANQAFITLFELKTDVRGKTLIEALRLHELAEL